MSKVTAPQRLRVHVRGAVQGVGFRPFVYRLATELGLRGWVVNSSSGVQIEVDGAPDVLERFLLRVRKERPPRAIIQGIEASYLDPGGFAAFEIRESAGGEKTALVLPDIATCPDCLAELRDPDDRRFRYPFTNCTNCGPRFTIIEALPYDRPSTTMARFPMCEACASEYHDPRDRRFHAQPNACPICGPQLELWAADGACTASRDAALKSAEDKVRAGQVVAVKGIGGFHLVVDARSETAVQRLRQAKAREEKPFALMFPSLAAVRQACEVSESEAALLESPEAPIVLLRRRGEGGEAAGGAAGKAEGDTAEGGEAGKAEGGGKAADGQVADAVAPGNPYLGVMLPSTPLHHLLLDDLGFPIVATSGNRSDEPICTDEREALERLRGMADAFLVHNRPIARHVDDSIVRVAAGRELVLRRARGYAPLPVAVEEGSEPVSNRADPHRRVVPATVLGVGAHLKNSVALSVGKNVFVSQHIGDLETPEAFEAFERVIGAFERMYDAAPTVIAGDAHPDYLSTSYGRRRGIEWHPVQHHLAHVLGCMAENESAPPALGVSWDGTGFGLDGTVWGGEFFSVMPGRAYRVASFRSFRLPGGDRAIREPRRAAVALLADVFGDAAWEMEELPAVSALTRAERQVIREMIGRGVNAPFTSSVGRLFDAVAALAGLRQHVRYEGQAAMELEFALDGLAGDEAYPLGLGLPTLAAGTTPPAAGLGPPASGLGSQSLGLPRFDWAPLVRAVVEDVRRGVPVGRISARFHNALVETIVEVAARAGHERVVMSGGCFQNRYLLERAVRRLEEEGFRPAWPQRVPPNDGGIALGQVAAVKWGITLNAG